MAKHGTATVMKLKEPEEVYMSPGRVKIALVVMPFVCRELVNSDEFVQKLEVAIKDHVLDEMDPLLSPGMNLAIMESDFDHPFIQIFGEGGDVTTEAAKVVEWFTEQFKLLSPTVAEAQKEADNRN